MLNGISKIISPELLMFLDKMGHGNEIVLSDGNFSGESTGRNVLRADGSGVCDLLRAILPLFPLDAYNDNVFLMDKLPCDKDLNVPIWEEYKSIVKKYTDREPVFLSRSGFYERAAKSFVIVVTGETAIYANVILKKGVVFQ